MSDTASGPPPVLRPADRPKQIVTPLSGRAVLATAVGTALVVAAVVTALWVGLTTDGTDPSRVTARLEVLRIGLSLGLGGGGLFALYLAWRRQRSTDLALLQKERDQADVARAYALQERVAAENRAHQERVALATETDATARRITELLGKAVEHLGAGEAPVRLGGLYALERLAQDNSEQRQTIVNVICAYLRMPVDPAREPGEDPDADRQRQREHEVRLTAQRILTGHLRPGPEPGNPAATFWPGLELDLTGAVLLEADFSGCHLHVLKLNSVTFLGAARFAGTTFAEDAAFEHAAFTGEAQFGHATFAGRAQFRGMTFPASVDFAGTKFLRGARFEDASFTADAGFTGAKFARRAWFARTVFARGAEFGSARFATDAEFRGAVFTGNTRFVATTFAGNANFHGVAFRRDVSFREAVFARDVSFRGGVFDGAIGLRDATFRKHTEFRGTRFAQAPRVTAGQFPGGVPPELPGPATA
ncbi:pentapeptide repeat-containing protein [Amycolatopsis sp. A133]|uniref:pentapeptide repeat-containing protein n=1 Tax=Amycolatopsis sp. A133 TaxID=3064472 RepID=UPI0027F6E20C|nr:pentapeptide repeat-containing protein [Amycolatopsis sp. A133]MDQ7804790.1 pentapeptide repeat-containing protein [Amycolatopsis sp. A133]